MFFSSPKIYKLLELHARASLSSYDSPCISHEIKISTSCHWIFVGLLFSPAFVFSQSFSEFNWILYWNESIHWNICFCAIKIKLSDTWDWSKTIKFICIDGSVQYSMNFHRFGWRSYLLLIYLHINYQRFAIFTFISSVLFECICNVFLVYLMWAHTDMHSYYGSTFGVLHSRNIQINNLRNKNHA